MIFEDLRQKVEDLLAELWSSAGDGLLHPISLEPPTEPKNELHFLKLVAWGYGAVVEAGPAALRHLAALLRNSDQEAAKRFTTARQALINLRTFYFHNLLVDSRHDRHKQDQARLWLEANGGSPVDWSKCCDALTMELSGVFDSLLVCWKSTISSLEDRPIAIQRLRRAVSLEWPAHEFDGILANVVSKLRLEGLDIPKYRDTRLEDWQRLAGLFQSPEDARMGIERAILSELSAKFGHPEIAINLG
jgi:hypothetical protein